MRLPKVKPPHAPHRFDDGTIRIGGELYGLAAEIMDRHGWIWDALAMMNGRTPVDLIAERLSQRYDRLARSQAERLIAELIATGYIEDAALDGAEVLSADELERYSRNIAYFRYVDLRPGSSPYTAQRRLRDARVVVVGIGGVGTHVAWALSAAGIGSLHLVDPDRVEPSNLSRQMLFDERDVGGYKAEVAARRLEHVNSTGDYTFRIQLADSEEKLFEAVRGCDVLALCADEPRNGEIATMASRACHRAGLPWVRGGYNGPLVTVGVYSPEGPCVECMSLAEQSVLKHGWMPDMRGQGALSTTAGLAGGLLAHEVISLITGTGAAAPGHVRGINLVTPDEAIYVRHPARPDCSLCRP
ncbi:ThiF family adenylyltransferase [Streptomyces fragilis]|uniref:ThiF family adenylyltransferase n=1 Tax=Streptomyces fragilis TaxID=67301 RepID=A0ABV2YCU5_9ACTN|nr:ThiF family adenylyltransferase [Streptomyces fragilis]